MSKNIIVFYSLIFIFFSGAFAIDSQSEDFIPNVKLIKNVITVENNTDLELKVWIRTIDLETIYEEKLEPHKTLRTSLLKTFNKIKKSIYNPNEKINLGLVCLGKDFLVNYDSAFIITKNIDTLCKDFLVNYDSVFIKTKYTDTNKEDNAKFSLDKTSCVEKDSLQKPGWQAYYPSVIP